MEEENSPKIISFQESNNPGDLRQEDDAAESDEDMEDNLEAHFVRDSFIDPATGRRRQMLICRQCGLRTPKLCNMRDHIKCHMALKNYKCSICRRGFV